MLQRVPGSPGLRPYRAPVAGVCDSDRIIIAEAAVPLFVGAMASVVAPTRRFERLEAEDASGRPSGRSEGWPEATTTRLRDQIT
jgi:hypothetical protein